MTDQHPEPLAATDPLPDPLALRVDPHRLGELTNPLDIADIDTWGHMGTGTEPPPHGYA